MCYHGRGAGSRPARCAKCYHLANTSLDLFVAKEGFVFKIPPVSDTERKYGVIFYLYGDFRVLKCRFSHTRKGRNRCGVNGHSLKGSAEVKQDGEAHQCFNARNASTYARKKYSVC